jgi:hypothetical protein
LDLDLEGAKKSPLDGFAISHLSGVTRIEKFDFGTASNVTSGDFMF